MSAETAREVIQAIEACSLAGTGVSREQSLEYYRELEDHCRTAADTIQEEMVDEDGVEDEDDDE